MTQALVFLTIIAGGATLLVAGLWLSIRKKKGPGNRPS